MAIVKCRFCEQPVSDKAVKCPSCGKALIETESNEQASICRECGETLPAGAATCPTCGCPVEACGKEEPDSLPPEGGEAVSIGAVSCSNYASPVYMGSAENNAQGFSNGGQAEYRPAYRPPAQNEKSNSASILVVVLGIAAILMIVLGSIYYSSNALTGDDKIAYELLYDAAHNFKNPSSVRLVSGSLGVEKDCLFCRISATNGFGARTSSYYYVSEDFVMEEEPDSFAYTNTTELNIERINKKLEKTLGSD